MSKVLAQGSNLSRGRTTDTLARLPCVEGSTHFLTTSNFVLPPASQRPGTKSPPVCSLAPSSFGSKGQLEKGGTSRNPPFGRKVCAFV